MKTKYKITLQPGDHCRRDMGEEKYRECVQRFFEDGMPEGGEEVGSWEHEPFFGWSAHNKKAGLFHGIKTTGFAENRLSGRLLTHAEIMECEYIAEVGDVFEVVKCELAGARLGVGSKVTVEECNGRGGFFVDTSNMLFNDHINNGLKYVGRVGELQKDNTRLGWHVSNETTREQILSTVFGHSLFGIGRPDIPEPQYDPADVAFKRETEWSGEGLPPVGTVCEALCGDGWRPSLILARDSEWAWAKVEGRHMPLTTKNPDQFRPLKTDRERWVEAAMKQCRTLSKHDCQAIYDAGLAGGVE